MSWLSLSLRRSVWAMIAVLCTGSTSSLLPAQSPDEPFAYDPAKHSLSDYGKLVFEHQWTYTERKMPEIKQVNRGALMFQIRRLPGDGLGPMHNADSCAACHPGGGAAGVERNVTMLTLSPLTPIVMVSETRSRKERQDARAKLLQLHPGLLTPRGQINMEAVVHEASTRPGYQEFRNRIADHIAGGPRWFDPQSRTIESIRQNPVLAGRIDDIDFFLSQRNTPPLHGLGWIDRIPMSRLETLAESQPKRTDGRISGRVGAGKFGWRGQTSTLASFVAGACANELGLQRAGFSQADDPVDLTYISFGSDMGPRSVTGLNEYVRTLPAPQQIKAFAQPAKLRKGKQLFVWSGCNDCHVENLYPAKGIYSDLLLHDMGPELQSPAPAPVGRLVSSQDSQRLPTFPPPPPRPGSNPDPFQLRQMFPNLTPSYYGSASVGSTRDPRIPIARQRIRPTEPQFPWKAAEDTAEQPNPLSWDSLQREWKTPPLWGVADSAPYLHDGRARTLDQAIRLHGGEAAESAARYMEYSDENQALVLLFLRSLRAPGATDVFQPVYINLGPDSFESDMDLLRSLATRAPVFE